MPDYVDAVLETIRDLESGGNYRARNSSSSASGAYQFIDSTWRGLGGGAYAPSAYLATPAQQDAIARSYVQSILAKHPNDPTAIPETWYVGSTSRPDTYRPPGNTLTVGEYVKKWQDTLAHNLLGGGSISDQAGQAWDRTKDAVVDPVVEKINEALGALAEPFLEGLRRISIIGLAVLGGVALVVAGGWRGLKASG